MLLTSFRFWSLSCWLKCTYFLKMYTILIDNNFLEYVLTVSYLSFDWLDVMLMDFWYLIEDYFPSFLFLHLQDYDPYEENPGTGPFSEPETQIMRKLAISFEPHIWVNVHSGMEVSYAFYCWFWKLFDFLELLYQRSLSFQTIFYIACTNYKSISPDWVLFGQKNAFSFPAEADTTASRIKTFCHVNSLLN